MVRFVYRLLYLCFLSFPVVAAPSKPIVTAEIVAKVALFDEITYPAQVSSQINANVLAEIDGVVLEILQPIGATVHVGTPILSIKNTDPVYEYVPVIVMSNLAGVISSQDISVGSMVRKGQVIAAITDPTKLILKVEVTARDLRFMSRGLEGQYAQSGLEKSVPFKIKGISPLIDAATGTATVELASTHADAKKLAVGSIGKLTFKTNSRKGIVVPEQALVYRGADIFVRVIANEKAMFKKVAIGTTRRGVVELSSGLNEGEQIITRTSVFVAEGQDVTVQASDVAKK